jgi:AcrR family transcriptional regulator
MSRRQRAEPTLDEAEPSSRRGRRPNPLVDAAIRTATLELISEVGYDHVTFEAVATRAGVSRNAVYRRWGSRVALVYDVVNAVEGARLPPPPNTGTLAGDLCTLLKRIVRRFENPQWASTAGDMIAAAQNDPDIRRRIREGADLMVPGVRTILRRAVERGELEEEPNADAIGQMLLGIGLYRVVAVDGDPAPVISAFETLLHSNAKVSTRQR